MQQITIFSFTFAPKGWAQCNGQLLPINQNQALFSLLGTTYGGNGQTTFALPDLRGRIPIHQGNGFILAETGGAETITLTVNQIPLHNHSFLGTSAPAASRDPQSNTLAVAAANIYTDQASLQALNAQSVTASGGSQPHENLQPYLCVSFIISLFGIFPSPT